jgi:hypothetical protein
MRRSSPALSRKKNRCRYKHTYGVVVATSTFA